jgi:D-alanyl-D-alanine carboxypeptidase
MRRPVCCTIPAAVLPLLFAAALAAQTPQSQSARPADVATRIANDPDVLAQQRLFSAWMNGQIEYRELPGIVVGIVAGDDLVWAKGFGFADLKARKPMTAETRFRMASHSKLFTATAIMQLREQGKVRLDDPVSKHLSWFRVKPAGEDDGPVTVEQLLTHSSGLPREAGAHWTTGEFPTADEIRSLIADREAAFAPSVRWKYSNLAYTIAGMVVEQASGVKWADYVQTNIFAPLSMTSSSVDRDVEGMAVGYGARVPTKAARDVMAFTDARGMAAATGITSTVGDMAKFVSAQFRQGPRGGNRVLGSGSLREMHRLRSMENNWLSGNGIGFAGRRQGTRVWLGHGGGYPGYTTQTLFNLESKVGVIVLTNTNDSNPGDIATQLINTVADAVIRASAEKPKQVAWDPSWARFAGRYRGARGGETEVVLLNNKLAMINPWGPNLENVTNLEPIGAGRFRLVAPSGGGPVGEIVRFVEQNGRVTRIYVGDGFSERVDR